MNIEILSGEVKLQQESPSIYTIAFGNIKENTVAKTKIKINGIVSSTLDSTCGCTATGSTEKNIYEIEYKNTDFISAFSKVLVLNYIEDGARQVANIKITGNVIQE